MHAAVVACNNIIIFITERNTSKNVYVQFTVSEWRHLTNGSNEEFDAWAMWHWSLSYACRHIVLTTKVEAHIKYCVDLYDNAAFYFTHAQASKSQRSLKISTSLYQLAWIVSRVPRCVVTSIVTSRHVCVATDIKHSIVIEQAATKMRFCNFDYAQEYRIHG